MNRPTDKQLFAGAAILGIAVPCYAALALSMRPPATEFIEGPTKWKTKVITETKTVQAPPIALPESCVMYGETLMDVELDLIDVRDTLKAATEAMNDLQVAAYTDNMPAQNAAKVEVANQYDALYEILKKMSPLGTSGSLSQQIPKELEFCQNDLKRAEEETAENNADDD